MNKRTFISVNRKLLETAEKYYEKCWGELDPTTSVTPQDIVEFALAMAIEEWSLGELKNVSNKDFYDKE